ncbi:MAG: beta-galactosidase/beta-glucuronidase [Massilia sp.]|nr:beta-galactosidase/beta-glucuronidase [Massilia sp.]
MPAPLALTDWKLIDTDPGAGVGLAMPTAPLEHPAMIAAAAPGDLYLALHAAGRLPHPMADRAEAACAWVREREWWYRLDFEAPLCECGQRVVLEFDGLDTFASVWLNGQRLGSADNMFRQWRFDLQALLRDGANRLAVCFTPPLLAIAAVEMPPFPMASSPSAVNKRNFMRKAQFGWGWDFAPDLLTTGIWKAARIKVETRAVLRDVGFATLAIGADGAATVRMVAGVDHFAAGAALFVTLRLVDPDGIEIYASTHALADGACTAEPSIAGARLWWTQELGAAPLYTMRAELHGGGVLLDARSLRVGIRTVALDTSPDPQEPGTKFFRFVLNGVPLFARGVNWVPPSSLVAAIDAPLYRRLLNLAAAANMNMVRVWGGGIYEHDAFYDICDELGILVWQDFMFACAPYPEHDPVFAENVRAEVADQVRRLRHHACLALWCGNNESQAIQGFANSKAGHHQDVLGELYYQRVIPAVLAELDPATPYRPGSPYGGGGAGHNHNSMLEGDIHDWTVWHGLPVIPDSGPVGEYDRSPAGVAYTRYAEDLGRFISEYGIQSAPTMAALRRALPADQLVLGSAGFVNRIKDRPLDKVNAMLVTSTGLPASIEEYVDFTQINQAEGLQFGIEHFRRRKPHCSGSLIWQFNDCWPGISWSIVDYYGFAKAAYYFVKRAYAPVMASFRQADGDVELWVVNDTLAVIEGECEIALDTFDGAQSAREKVAYALAPNSSTRVGRCGDSTRLGARHVLSVRDAAARFPANRHFFVAIKDLQRAAPRAPTVAIEQLDKFTAAITIAASDYLYFVHVLGEDEDLVFDDNHIDLQAGETRVLTVRHPHQRLDSASLQVRWR